MLTCTQCFRAKLKHLNSSLIQYFKHCWIKNWLQSTVTAYDNLPFNKWDFFKYILYIFFQENIFYPRLCLYQQFNVNHTFHKNQSFHQLQNTFQVGLWQWTNKNKAVCICSANSHTVHLPCGFFIKHFHMLPCIQFHLGNIVNYPTALLSASPFPDMYHSFFFLQSLLLYLIVSRLKEKANTN